jgi:DNA-binding response OmpR family regulator
MEVMLLDNDRNFAMALYVVLAEAGFRPTYYGPADTPQAHVLEVVGGRVYDAILLGWGPSNPRAPDFLRGLRRIKSLCSLILLAEDPAVIGEDVAVGLGADAILPKSGPSSALIRRMQMTAGEAQRAKLRATGEHRPTAAYRSLLGRRRRAPTALPGFGPRPLFSDSNGCARAVTAAQRVNMKCRCIH